jgi:HPt (histidine-containing phosphotransfer) domain-containing protein
MKIPAELKRKYLDRRIKDLENLRHSLNQDDYSPALKLGHQVKGNAVTFDFHEIAPFGVAMEIAAQVKDKEQITHIIIKMEELIHMARLSIAL